MRKLKNSTIVCSVAASMLFASQSVLAAGGTVAVIEFTNGYSTTKLIDQLKK